MATKEYRLNRNAGAHTCSDGSTVRPGETFESEVDVCKMFPGKFTCLSDQEKEPDVDQDAAEERREKEREAAAKKKKAQEAARERLRACLLYTSPSPRDRTRSRMPSSA